MKYQTIVTIKESEKATVELAAIELFVGPVIVKRLKGGNPEIYRLLSTKSNPHIPQIYAVEEQEKELLVAEEYVDGESLSEHLQKNLLSDEQKLNYALQLCEAVGFLHALNPSVIHRDIKPSNILINGKGELKLIDFDASRHYKEAPSSSDTRLLGTVEYAPPEQFGYSQTDVRSDIYSMGVVFHEMRPTENKRLAEQWEKIAEKCTSFDPKNRYQSVAELKRELEKLAAWKKSRKGKIAAWIGGIAVLFVVAVLSVVMWHGQGAAKDVDGANMTTVPTSVPTDAPTLIPTNVPTLTPTNIPTETPTPEPTASMTPTITLGPSTLPTSINQHYYKGLAKETELILCHGSDTAQRPETWEAECYDYYTGITYQIPMEEIEIGPGYIRFLDKGLEQLEATLYKLTVNMYYANSRSQSTSRVLKVYAEEERLINNKQPMSTSTYYFYKNNPHDFLKNIISTFPGVFTGVWMESDEGQTVEIASEWYTMYCDNKVLVLKKEFLQQYYEEGKQFKLIYHFDDGGKQSIVINFKEDQ